MRVAVIPTKGRVDLEDCMRAIAPQVQSIILIAHKAKMKGNGKNIHVLDYEPDGPPNISVMWNMGLTMAYNEFQADHVAVLNDDAIVFPGWLDKITAAMSITGARAGWASGEHRGHLLYQTPGPTMYRMSGYAFVLDAWAKIYADPQFHWWYGDNDIEWRAREMGGVVQVGGSIEHRHPNETTVGALAVIAGEDAKRFKKKWGMTP